MPRITERAIKALKAPDKGNTVIWDSDPVGFGARITSAGVVSFVLRYVIRGRERRYTIGRFPDLSPTAAREQATALRGKIVKGVDPLEERQAGHRAGTISALCERYLEEHVAAHNKPRTQEEVKAIVERIIKPKIGTMSVEALGSPDIAKLHHGLRTTPRQANHVISILSKMLNLAELWKLRPENSNPCRMIRRYKENKRERFLSDAEMRTLGEALSKTEQEGKISQAAIDALRLLAMTGCRLSEICNLTWDDVNLENYFLLIREAKAGGRTHPIGAPVAAYLKTIQERTETNWVIPSPRNPKAPLPMTTLERAWKEVCIKAGIENVRIHDLRHTVGTYAGATGANAFLIRDKLGHKTLAMTGRYVNRDSDPMRKLSDEVETRIGAAIGLMKNTPSAEVVKMKARRKK